MSVPYVSVPVVLQQCVEQPEALGTHECVCKPFVVVVTGPERDPVKNHVVVPASCLAVSTTGSLEGTSLIARGNMLPLSEQHLVDLQIFKDHVGVIHTAHVPYLQHLECV